MRASRAYVNGFGTTGILLCFTLLLLLVFSAIMTFRGWPYFTTDDSDAVRIIDAGSDQRPSLPSLLSFAVNPDNPADSIPRTSLRTTFDSSSAEAALAPRDDRDGGTVNAGRYQAGRAGFALGQGPRALSGTPGTGTPRTTPGTSPRPGTTWRSGTPAPQSLPGPTNPGHSGSGSSGSSSGPGTTTPTGGGVTEPVGETVSGTTETAGGAAQETVDTTQGTAGGTVDTAPGTVDSTVDTDQETVDSTKRKPKKHDPP